MIETMEDAPGAGLAAPQVHVPLRLFVFRVPPDRGTGDPEDTPVGQHRRDQPHGGAARPGRGPLRWEGCLSIPGLRAAVPRAGPHPLHAASIATATRSGGDVTGFHAGVVQHEYDHLDGILYPMRMTDFSLFGFTEELARAAATGMP